MARGVGWRSSATRALSLLALSSLCAQQVAAGDFNPEGRRKRPAEPPAASRPAAPRPAAPPAQGKETPAAAASGSEALIARYFAILDQDPGAEFPLERLVQLYRQRDGNLDALLRHFEPLAARNDASGQR